MATEAPFKTLLGRVRLLVPRLTGTIVLGPKLAKFTRDYA